MDALLVTAAMTLAGVVLGAFLQSRSARQGERRLWAVELQRRMMSFRQFLFDLREAVERALATTSDAKRRQLLGDAWALFTEDWSALRADAAAYLRLVPKIDNKFAATLVAQSAALEHAVDSGDAYNVRTAVRPLLETVDVVIQVLDEVIGVKDD
jgi:hypothetical protein